MGNQVKTKTRKPEADEVLWIGIYCRFPPASAIARTVIIVMLAEGYRDKDYGPIL